MTATAIPSTPADEVLEIVADLHAFFDARMKEHPVFAGMFFYIFCRIHRLRDHLVRLAARIRAGVPARRRVRAPLSEEAALIAGHKSRRRVRNLVQWSQKSGALAAMLSHEATPFVERLRAFLANPEAVAFIVANPGIGRYLRPLCRTLGVPLIPELRLRRRKPIAPVGRKSAAPSASSVCLQSTLPVVPPPAIPVASMRTFTPSEDDPPMAERVARHLARSRFTWREL